MTGLSPRWKQRGRASAPSMRNDAVPTAPALPMKLALIFPRHSALSLPRAADLGGQPSPLDWQG